MVILKNRTYSKTEGKSSFIISLCKFEKELYSREVRSRNDLKKNRLYSELRERWIRENKPLHYCFIDLDSLEKFYINK